MVLLSQWNRTFSMKTYHKNYFGDNRSTMTRVHFQYMLSFWIPNSLLSIDLTHRLSQCQRRRRQQQHRRCSMLFHFVQANHSIRTFVPKHWIYQQNRSNWRLCEKRAHTERRIFTIFANFVDVLLWFCSNIIGPNDARFKLTLFFSLLRKNVSWRTHLLN